MDLELHSQVCSAAFLCHAEACEPVHSRPGDDDVLAWNVGRSEDLSDVVGVRQHQELRVERLALRPPQHAHAAVVEVRLNGDHGGAAALALSQERLAELALRRQGDEHHLLVAEQREVVGAPNDAGIVQLGVELPQLALGVVVTLEVERDRDPASAQFTHDRDERVCCARFEEGEDRFRQRALFLFCLIRTTCTLWARISYHKNQILSMKRSIILWTLFRCRMTSLRASYALSMFGSLIEVKTEQRLLLGDVEIQFLLARSVRARRLRLTMQVGGVLVVTVPMRVSLVQIEGLLRQHAQWILKQRMRQLKKVVQHLPAMSDVAAYRLYKQATKDRVAQSLTLLSQSRVLPKHSITIKNHRTRWGSCSKKGNLNFNYRLALLPEELAHYVVVHEVCHLYELNHSIRFWNQVAHFLPDYRTCRLRLREYVWSKE